MDKKEYQNTGLKKIGFLCGLQKENVHHAQKRKARQFRLFCVQYIPKKCKIMHLALCQRGRFISACFGRHKKFVCLLTMDEMTFRNNLIHLIKAKNSAEISDTNGHINEIEIRLKEIPDLRKNCLKKNCLAVFRRNLLLILWQISMNKAVN